jgi:hypothetical protein
MPAPNANNVAKAAAREALKLKPGGFAARDGKNIYYCGTPDKADDIIEAGIPPLDAEVFVDAIEAARNALRRNKAEAFSIPMGDGLVLFYGTPDDAPLIQYTLN